MALNASTRIFRLARGETFNQAGAPVIFARGVDSGGERRARGDDDEEFLGSSDAGVEEFSTE